MSDTATNGEASVQNTGTETSQAPDVGGLPAADSAPVVPSGADAPPLKYPEGVELDAQVKDAFENLRAGKMTHQAFLDAFILRAKETAEAAQKKQADDRAAREKAWADELAKDATFGGTHLQASIAAADKALKHLSPDGALAAVLSEAGLGKNPAVVRAFAKIGQGLSEDSVAGTSQPPASAWSRENFLKALYS